MEEAKEAEGVDDEVKADSTDTAARRNRMKGRKWTEMYDSIPDFIREEFEKVPKKGGEKRAC